MGYRVEYSPVRKVRGLEKRISRAAALTGMCLLVFFLLVGSLWPEGSAILRRLVFPGDPVVAAAALEDLTEELRENADVTDSLRSFCIRILEGADIAADR